MVSRRPKSKKVTQKARKAAPQKAKTVVMRRPGLDKAAADYARLIKDPCNAPLCPTIWPGSEGAFIGRYETDLIIWNQATAVAGVLVWCPGINTFFANDAILTSDTTAATLNLETGLVPGNGFLNNSSVVGSFRPVASCLQVMFPGTELNRSGVVAMGVTRFDPFINNVQTADGGLNVGITASQTRALCQHTERMPATMAECLWQPGPEDANTVTLGGSATQQTNACIGRNVVVLSASGFPVNTGVRVRIVTVVEWTPANTNGIVSSIEPPRSSNTINDVLRMLPADGGTNWFINAYQKARPLMNLAGNVISYAVRKGAPALLAM